MGLLPPNLGGAGVQFQIWVLLIIWSPLNQNLPKHRRNLFISSKPPCPRAIGIFECNVNCGVSNHESPMPRKCDTAGIVITI